MIHLKTHQRLTIPVHDCVFINSIWVTVTSKSKLMILMFPLLKDSFLSPGSSRIISTLAQLQCACTKIPDKISPLTISSGGVTIHIICSTKNENTR